MVGFWLGEDVHRNQLIPTSIELLTLNARDMSNMLQNGTVSTVQLVEEYLDRIALDNLEGLGLHPILSLTSRDFLLDDARRLDEERRQGSLRSVLHGVPFLAKGNMATEAKLGMATSAGAYALQNASASSDAFIIAKAREAGLLLMGKANLGEFGGFKDNDISPSWSSLGGETTSPYDYKHPCGSSGGSVVAVAAGFAPIALGTET